MKKLPQRRAAYLAVFAIVLAACGPAAVQPAPPAATRQPGQVALDGIHKIKHVIVIMQENRSFDTYFGTYPGADGLPVQNGRFTTCVGDPATGVPLG